MSPSVVEPTEGHVVAMLVTGGRSSRVTQCAERDGQRGLDVIAAPGDQLSTAEMGDRPTGKVVGPAPALVTGDRSVRGA
jgi:hypothetical protein